MKVEISIDAKINTLKRKIKRLENEISALELEKAQDACPFKVGDIVYVYEYRDEKVGGFWHPVKVKRFFHLGSLGFAFTPADKRGQNLMRWRQAYFPSDSVSLTLPPIENEVKN